MTLDSGETIEADVVVLGVGVVPNTEFLASSSIPRDQRGYIPVNEVSQRSAILLDSPRTDGILHYMEYHHAEL